MQENIATPMGNGTLPVLFITRLAFPLILLATSLSVLFVKPPSGRIKLQDASTTTVTCPRRAQILTILSLVALTYFFDGVSLIVHSVVSRTWQGIPEHGPWWQSQWSGLEIEAVTGLLASGLLAIIGLWKDHQNVAVWTTWRPKLWTGIAVTGSGFELSLAFSTADLFHTSSGSLNPHNNIPTVLHITSLVLRVLLLLLLYPTLAYPRLRYISVSETTNADLDVVTAAALTENDLLARPKVRSADDQGSQPNGQATNGTTTSGSAPAPPGANPLSPTPSSTQETASLLKKPDDQKKEEVDKRSLKETCRRVIKLNSRLWPKKSFKLQFFVVVCVLIVFIERVVRAAMPLIFAKIVDILNDYASSTPQTQIPSFWPPLLFYVGLSFLSTGGGLGSLRSALWLPVSQYMERVMTKITFTHLLSLSLTFHTHRKTGEVLKVLERGAVINMIFSWLFFTVGPAILDIILAIGILRWKFDWLLSVVLVIVMIAYATSSMLFTKWMAKIRRDAIEKDNEAEGIHTDTILNYETVKYFCGEDHETERYDKAIQTNQVAWFRLQLSGSFMNMVQNLITTTGYLIGGITIAVHISQRKSAPSDFVAFNMYFGLLFTPLNIISYQYKRIYDMVVDAEKLINLLEQPTEVNDKPGAPDLVVTNGEIEFDNVRFSYDERATALKAISFKIPKGSSVALVGASGSGKSTVLRLLYRFYDLKEGEGRILIDGQDIRDVTQLSLRRAIGIVPQEPVLFNNTVAYNIEYGKIGAPREAVEAAAKVARMHDKITSFSDGYDTMVGERGVRLSGGEKQRVAIARTLVKDPPILVLDEATSALDTSTEKDIQAALNGLMRGRSTLSVAHRLSTIASANLILVLKDGQVVERGTHRELLQKNGLFAQMWADQVSVTDPQLVPPASTSGASSCAAQSEQGNGSDNQTSLISL